MKLNLDFSKNGLTESIKHEKELLIPISVLLASAVLFIVFILPNLLSFPTKISDRNLEVEKLDEIKEAKQILSVLNTTQLEKEYEIADQALPGDKNFELILGAISEAAIRSNVQIDSYQFVDKISAGAQDKSLGLIFDINIAGSVQDAANFVNELYESYPISNVESISYTNGIATVNMQFYYKPIASLNPEEALLVKQKSPKQSSALSKIAGWNKVDTSSIDLGQIEPATEGAQVNPF